MKISPLVLPLIFLFASCGGNQSAPKTDSDSLKTISKIDSVPAAPKTPIADLLGGDTIAPHDASVILFHFDNKLAGNKSKSLSVKDVRSRFMPIDSACDPSAANVLSAFFTLAKKKGGSDDIGSIVEVIVRLVDTLKVSPAFTTVTWTMTYRTVEACPYSAGTYYMASTYDKSGKIISTQQLGLSISGADAPVSYSNDENGNVFNDGSFKSVRIDSTTETKDNGKEKTAVEKHVFKGTIQANGKIVRQEVKG
jgi:hypothetical protein